jgi:hypothetical protein
VILGIVGSEKAKFTPVTEAMARRAIRGAILTFQATKVCSGRCPIGGIDIWAVEEAVSLLGPGSGIEFPPTKHQWAGKGGYQERNIQIAQTSDVVVCFTVAKLPETYVVKGWEYYCYHCGTDKHIKSGGCWTTRHARSLGKTGFTVTLREAA